MTTTELVVLGVVVLTAVVTLIAVSVCHARTVLNEAELRTGVRRCGMKSTGVQETCSLEKSDRGALRR